MKLDARVLALAVAALVACGGGTSEETAATGRVEAAAGPATAAGLETVVLTVPSMSCPLCARSIEARLTEAGLRDIRIDLEAKRVTAVFDPSRTTVAEVKGLVEGQGYPVTEMRTGEAPQNGAGR